MVEEDEAHQRHDEYNSIILKDAFETMESMKTMTGPALIDTVETLVREYLMKYK